MRTFRGGVRSKLRIATFCSCVAWLAAWSAPAAAGEDGGTASVFDRGAGLRALALGGAYAGVADDASAWMWNPGGLGFADRTRMQLAQEAPSGLGYSEYFAGVTVPSWRWGAVTSTFRQLRVDGIDGRDARNFPTASLEDVQSEFGFGYGKEVSRGVGVGTAAKVRTHELAGLTGTGVGLDLGVMIHPGALLENGPEWLRDVSVGVSLQNAVSPQMRLLRESVSDSRMARIGFAYRRPLWTGGGLLATLDTEHPQHASTRMRAGLECSATPDFALRIGMLQSGLTAGAGFEYGRMAFEYAFENGALDEIHRVGLSMRFGRTIDQSRAAAIEERDREMQSRLAETYERDRKERVGDLFGQAQAAHARGDTDAALETLAMLRLLDPGNFEAVALAVGIHRARAERAEREGDLAQAMSSYRDQLALAPADTLAAAGAARCRAAFEQDTSRSSGIQEAFKSGLLALSKDDFATARRHFRSVLEDEPGNAQALALVAHVERVAAARAGTLLETVAGQIRRGEWESAGRSLTDAAALGADRESVARLTETLAEARRKSQERVAARPGASHTPARRAGGAAADPREVQAAYQRGLAAAQKGRTDEAVRWWESAWAMDPSHRGASEALAREYLRRGLDAFAAGNLASAITQWERVLRIDSGNARAAAYLAHARAHLSKAQQLGAQ